MLETKTKRDTKRRRRKKENENGKQKIKRKVGALFGTAKVRATRRYISFY